MKQIRKLILFCAGVLTTIAPALAEGQRYERVQVEAPFPMDSVIQCTFPDKD